MRRPQGIGEQRSPGLTRVQRRLEFWRSNGGGRGHRIPEDLWQEAVEVARVEGVYLTARALGVDFSRLKERVGSADDAVPPSSRVGAPTFMELELGKLRGDGKTVVELSGSDGSGMRIEVTGSALVDVERLVQRFWSRSS